MTGLPTWFVSILCSIVLSGASLMPGFSLAMLYALGTVKLDVEASRVRLRGVDGSVMGVFVVAVSAAFACIAVLAWMGEWPIAWTVFLFGFLCVAPLGCRFVLEVSPVRSRLVRRFLWIIPWRVDESRGEPSVFVDGWGDWADPEALYVSAGGTCGDAEVAWGGSGSGSAAEDIARDFTRAVRVLRPSGMT